jgi:hypothetical protein
MVKNLCFLFESYRFKSKGSHKQRVSYTNLVVANISTYKYALNMIDWLALEVQQLHLKQNLFI